MTATDTAVHTWIGCTQTIATGKKAGHVCTKPAKGRIIGNQPVCGTHLRAAEARGDETRAL